MLCSRGHTLLLFLPFQNLLCHKLQVYFLKEVTSWIQLKSSRGLCDYVISFARFTKPANLFSLMFWCLRDLGPLVFVNPWCLFFCWCWSSARNPWKKKAAVCSSLILVSTYKSTRRCNPEDKQRQLSAVKASNLKCALYISSHNVTYYRRTLLAHWLCMWNGKRR
jgi:hypothetical protein